MYVKLFGSGFNQNKNYRKEKNPNKELPDVLKLKVMSLIQGYTTIKIKSIKRCVNNQWNNNIVLQLSVISETIGVTKAH